MENPKVTVLVPIYNVEKYVEKCIDSLLNQTFHEYEVWAVSDGSPDNSAEIIKEKYAGNNKVKLIEKENGGYGSVLKYGVDNIKTKYMIVCDPDDWLAEDALEKLVNFAEENGTDIVVADRYDVYESEEKDSEDYEYNEINVFRDINVIKPRVLYTDPKMIQKFSFADVSPHAKLYRTEILRGINFPQKISYTDFILYILGLLNSKKVSYYNEPLAYYLIEREGNTTTDTSPKTIGYYLEVWNSTLDQVENMHKENSVILARLLHQLKYICRKFGMLKNVGFRSEYYINILKAYKRLLKYKDNIWINENDRFIVKILNRLMLNKYMYSFIVKLYIFVKKGK